MLRVLHLSRYDTGFYTPEDTVRYTTAELEALPTLSVGQADNLKVETHTHRPRRVWLSRCGVADGMDYENQITVEECHAGRWLTVDTYPGG